MIPIYFAPVSVDDAVHRDMTMIVVRRPKMRSYTGKVYGNVDERLAVVVELYTVPGVRHVVGVGADESPVYGGRKPVAEEIVWCSSDERDAYDRATGGSPGRPCGGTTGDPFAYFPVDGHRVASAIVRLCGVPSTSIR